MMISRMGQGIKHIEYQKACKLIKELNSENIAWCRQEKSQDSLRIIRDNIFDEKTHFILELVQNADDCSSNGVIFNLSNDSLIVENTGTPFDETNVKALSNIGRSTKGEDHIGFFGIGFKSVFQVTDAPEIHSGPYHFSYDNQNLIVPEWIENTKWTKASGTVFVFPLKKDRQIFREIKNQLNKFDGSVLLFLKHLNKIRVNNATFKIDSLGDFKNTFTLYKNRKQNSHWKRYSEILSIPKSKQKIFKDERGRKWAKKREEIAISFQVDKRGYPLLEKKCRLYAFFPTEITTGLSFNLQADFLVPLSRTTLQNPSGGWNQWIFMNAYRPVAKLIRYFKKTHNLKTAFYQLLPKKDDLHHDYLNPIKNGIDSYILKNPTVYTASGKWVKPSQALAPDKGIASLIEAKYLKEFFNTEKHYISEEIGEEGLAYLKEHVEQFTYNDLFDKVFIKSDWLKDRPLKWFIRLYALLWDWIQSLGYYGSWNRSQAIERIKKTKIFLSESGKLMAAKGKKRYLYRLGRQQASFASLFRNECELFNQRLYSKVLSDAIKDTGEKELRRKALHLISETVSTLSVDKILSDIIGPAFQDWESQSDTKLLKYTDFVRRFIIENIKPDMILLRKEGEEKSYLKPNQMFMLPEYSADASLKNLFNEDDVPFVSKHYIQNQLKRSSEKSKDKITSWRRFFQKLGVNERPTVEIKKENYNDKDIAEELKKYYPKSTVQSSNLGYKKKDCNFLKAFAKIIDSIEDERTSNRIEKAKIVVKVIDSNWDYYKEYLKSFYLFHVKGASEWREAEFSPSSLALAIQEKTWVPTQTGKLVKPSHVFLNLQTIKEVMGDHVEYLDGHIANRSLIKFAGFNDKPSIKAALNHLRGLSDRNVYDYDAFRRSYVFFDYFLQDVKSSAKDRDLVIKAFRSEPLIFIPGHKTQPYRNYTELVFSGPSFMNEFKPNLERYFDLESFFIDKIGVSPQPTTNDYVNFLIYLSSKNTLTSLEKEALLSSYGKLNDALFDEAKKITKGKQRTEKEKKIWEGLRKNGKIWCHDKTWTSFSDELYYNDSDHIYNIFKDSIKVIYLDPRKKSKPPTHFLREFGITGLKQATKEIAPEIEGEILREATENETEKIKSIIPYLRGFIKKEDPELFTSLRQSGIFHKLSIIDIRIVAEIKTYYLVNEIKKENQERKRAFYNSSNNTLYLAGGLRDCEDDIGITFSDILGDVPGMVDFFSRLVSLNEIERQNILQRRKMEWIDIDGEEGDDEGSSKTEEHEKDEDNEAKEYETIKPPRKRPRPVPKKTTFDAEAYLKEIDPLLESISVRQVEEKDLQEITKLDGPGGGGGGSSLWSGLTDEQRKQIGAAAEKVVYYKEKNRLKELFKNGAISEDLSEMIDYIAKRDDKAGYDIQSWDENGKKIFIEVKGTPDPELMQFLISREEFKKAEEKGESYFIYRVLNIREGAVPTIITLRNPFRLWRNNKIRLQSKQLLVIVELN